MLKSNESKIQNSHAHFSTDYAKEVESVSVSSREKQVFMRSQYNDWKMLHIFLCCFIYFSLSFQ